MVISYFFNIELSEALYPSLHAFEVALRNGVHRILSRYLGGEFWFDKPGLLLSWQQAAVQDVRDELTKHAKPHDAGRIVAELNFGFWHSMFNRPYEAKLWRRPGQRPGTTMLVDVFPGLPRPLRTRQTVWDRIEAIRRLRNRVMHYEPVWYRVTLKSEHAQILEILKWLSPDMHDAIALCDHFLMVHGWGRQAVEQKIKAHLHVPWPFRRILPAHSCTRKSSAMP